MANTIGKNFKKYLYIFVLLFLYKEILGSKEVRVTVEQGVLLGEQKITITGNITFYSFKGIPFAQPPVEELRFQGPQPPPKWQSVRNAKYHGPICVQPSAQYSDFIIGSEDCLYLNVYTPNMNPLKPLSVMFWIHGGNYLFGSGNDDMLGALGFLSVDTKDAPGNAGLKDQIAALQWVRRNINNFGGDPEKVTIFGQSSGGASVTYHLISPLAKGLFKRAIALSGSSLNEYGYTFSHKQRAFNLGKRLGINTNDPKRLIRFLREVPAERLVAKPPRILLSEKASVPVTIYFGPIIEKDLGGCHYLTEQPTEIKKKGQLNVVDFMRGYTEAEGLRDLLDQQDFCLEDFNKFYELFVPLPISRLKSPAVTLEIGETVKTRYFGEGTFVLNNASSFVDFLSSSYYKYPVHYFSDFFYPGNDVYNANNYFYVFNIISTRSVYSKPGGMRYGIYNATHSDDLPYMFHGSGYNITFDANDESYKYINLFCTLITNFAKYGNPTPINSGNSSLPIHYKKFVWPEYYKNMYAVVIGQEPSLRKVQYTNGDLAFWHRVFHDAGITPYVGDPCWNSQK